VVIGLCTNSRRAAIVTECLIAIAILGIAMIPLSYSFVHEAKLCRAYYYRALALEIIDGEMEALIAGEAKAWPAGEHPYPVLAASATNLPPGNFTFRRDDDRLRLEWMPKSRNQGGKVTREVRLK
jgi:hypothetical protein